MTNTVTFVSIVTEPQEQHSIQPNKLTTPDMTNFKAIAGSSDRSTAERGIRNTMPLRSGHRCIIPTHHNRIVLSGVLAAFSFSLVACAPISRGEIPVETISQNSPLAASELKNEPKTIEQTILLSGLNHPWGMAWISDQDILITERSGQVMLFSLDTLTKTPVSGIPEVFASGQGGLLDIVAHPNFQTNQWIYVSYSQGDRNQNKTTVARAKLQDNQLTQWTTVFEVADPKPGSQHFGSRLLWHPDGTLLITIGDGGNPPLRFNGELIRVQAQNLATHFGTVLRINDDGTIPNDNPDFGQSNARDEIWSYGHRNIQGLALDSKTGQIWSTEHGSRGGDELNLMQSGQNYGWPLVSFSREYQVDRKVAPSSSRAGFIDPKLEWTPSIAPSGLEVYRGDRYPDWDGNLFAGALVNRSLIRIVINENSQVTQQTEIQMGQRVRDVKQGPDGYLYVLTDDSNGRLVRLESNENSK